MPKSMGKAKYSPPEPFVFVPSQAWDGNDGSWSTFMIRVGTPGQTFRVLPSTSGHQVFLPVPEGCRASDPPDCANARGANLINGTFTGFRWNSSSTWEPKGLHNLDLESHLGLVGDGTYGLDSVGLTPESSSGISSTSQVIAAITTKDFYLGVLGLGPKPSNFSDDEKPHRSLMRTLKDDNKIPSLSFSYTAGSSYHSPRVPASLILGGYDESRFITNDHIFPFSANDLRSLEVNLQTITATNTLSGAETFLTTSILSLIDSTVPHIWLPRSTCDALESAFGLMYDPTTDLYLVNSTIHDQLLTLRPNLTFHLETSSEPLTITLPYSSLDLRATHPFYNTSIPYFPIRRATHSSQFTLGRTFLQEAYIIVDYEHSIFSVHQALFQDPMPYQSIITIAPQPIISEPTYTPQNSSTSLPKAAVIGIAAGVGILVLVLLAVFIYVFRRRQASRNRPKKRQSQRDSNVLLAQQQHQQREAEMAAREQYDLYDDGARSVYEMNNTNKRANLIPGDAAGGRMAQAVPQPHETWQGVLGKELRPDVEASLESTSRAERNTGSWESEDQRSRR